MKWFLAVCILLFIAALAVPQKATQAQVPHKPLVDEWFGVFESALSDLEATKGHWEYKTLDNGKTERVWVEPEFGLSRLPTIRGHRASTQTEYLGRANQEQAQEMLKASGQDLAVWGFGNRTEVLTKDTLVSRFRSARNYDSGLRDEDVKKFVTASFDSIMKGTIAFKKIGDWQVQTRLMRLTKKECLNCHVDNKLNDPVAIFAFATKPK